MVTDPTEVRELVNTSPSASTRNLTLLSTSRAKRLESATADEALTMREEVVALDPWVSIAQVGKVWGVVGEKLKMPWPALTRLPEDKKFPPTLKVEPGEVVPTPTLVLRVSKVRRGTAEVEVA